MKKVLAILIAVMFVVTLSVSAFAADNSNPLGIDTSSFGDLAGLMGSFTGGSGLDLSGLLGDSGSGIFDMLGGLTGQSGFDIQSVMGDVLGGVDGAALLDTLSQTVGSLGLGAGDLLGGLSPSGMDDLYAGLLDGLNGMGIDTGMLTDMLGESAIFNFFAGLYTAGATVPETTTEAPTTEEVVTTEKTPVDIPDTGSPAMGITVFAVLSVAAAAAYVARKKEA